MKRFVIVCNLIGSDNKKNIGRSIGFRQYYDSGIVVLRGYDGTLRYDRGKDLKQKR